MSAIKFGHAPDEVSMSMRGGDVVVTFTADQALDVAAKLAALLDRVEASESAWAGNLTKQRRPRK